MHELTLPATLPAGDADAIRRLWETLTVYGVNEPPNHHGQFLPVDGRSDEETYRMFLTESLFTGLYTNDRNALLRAYVQAHGYMERLKAMRAHPGAYIADVLRGLRVRAESHLLRGEGA